VCQSPPGPLAIQVGIWISYIRGASAPHLTEVRSRGGGNIVHNTSVTRDGDFALANSLVSAMTLIKSK
jgi:hypothetical protein